ncbi:MAG: phosphoenolpyruvate--protein phosphotransferase [Treponema sp.]|nr:phosphoenolpyruvate--protein phosphotransferase [Treponema sp.]
MDRLSRGNPGDVKPIGDGCSEMHIDYGPGYRIYYKDTFTAIEIKPIWRYFFYMKILSGIAAVPGIAIGKAFLYSEDLETPRYIIPQEQSTEEMKRFIRAVEEVSAELRILREKAKTREQDGIFAAHQLMVEDQDFHYKVKARFETNYENIEWVVSEVARELSRKLIESPNEYLRERTADVVDVSRRIIRNLLGIKRFSLADLQEEVILVARDLLPSEVLAFNKDKVKALLLDAGSRTNHAAILLRSFGIPGVFGLSSVTREITNGSLIIVDGGTGQVFIEPDNETTRRYKEQLANQEQSAVNLSVLKDFPAATTDSRRVSLVANIELPEEAEEIARYGAEGIGLYRSEFLFLQNGRNSEEEQLEAYSRVVKAMNGKPVTIRTVDLGGEKALPAIANENEKNPLMGWRAIRFSLSLPDLFKTQLRAILRASIHGKVQIMFPMISNIEELEQALFLLEEARMECRKKNQGFADDIKIGTMIEIPSAVMTADILAKKSDFFSIGTNDLIQYTLAVDQENERVRHLAKGTQIAVLRLIKQTIDAAHAAGIHAAMCGEMAGDPAAAALLLGLGLDEFSMNASAIPQVKHIIRNVSIESCKALAESALTSTSHKQVQELIRDWYSKHLPSLTLASDMILETQAQT